MERIQYLLSHDEPNRRIPLSIFLLADGTTVRALYYGDAGGGTTHDAFARIDLAADGGVGRMLECDNPDDEEFVLDRMDRTHEWAAVRLMPADEEAFRRLQAFRSTWWRFTEEPDEVRIAEGRTRALSRATPVSMDGAADWQWAASNSLDLRIVHEISCHWALHALNFIDR